MDGSLQGGTGARDLAAAFALSGARHDRDASFPHDHIARLRHAGLLRLTVPAAFGGGGGGLRAAADLVGTIAEGCASTALVLAMHLTHSRHCALNPVWDTDLQARIAADTASGALINTLRVEPALGTPARGGLPDTIARRTPEGWRLTGHKIYATGAPGLSWMLVWARTDEAILRTGNFLVPADAPGISVVRTWDQLGLRASGSEDILFEDVALPFDHAVELRGADAWDAPTPEQAAWNAVLIGALYTGVARAARDWIVSFLHSRRPSNLGAPLATLPRMQEAVGAIETKLLVNDRLLAGVAVDCDALAPPSTVESNLIKTVVADNAIAAVQAAVQLGGNHALARANPLERHLRDVLCARIHSPQPDVAYLAGGRQALGV